MPAREGSRSAGWMNRQHGLEVWEFNFSGYVPWKQACSVQAGSVPAE